MNPVEAVIEMVKKSLMLESVRLERQPENPRNCALVRYLFSSDSSSKLHQYVCTVKSGEPVEISIARRLMKGNLNLKLSETGVIPEVLSMLKEIEKISDNVFELSTNRSHDFDKLIGELYVQEVEVFQYDPLAVDDKLVFGAMGGNSDSIKQLDEQGYFRKVATLIMPDKFNLNLNLDQARNVGQNTYSPRYSAPEDSNVWYEKKNVKAEPGIENVIEIGLGTVLKIKGLSFLVKNDGFESAPYFNGTQDPKNQKISTKRVFSLEEHFGM